MTNPLLAFWQRILQAERAPGARRPAQRVPSSPAPRESTIFLVLRRMRAPLIGIVVFYAVSVLGLVLIPGVDDAGRPWRMGFFHAFYFVTYTATTIGFGEIPHAFTDAQRMWVTFSIYLTVVGWAWAVGTLLSLLQDHGFRRAIALRRFAVRVRALREPFVLVAGYGQTGQRLVRSLDMLDRRATVLDIEQDRIDDLGLAPLVVDVPGLVADARVPGHLLIAGLANPRCTAAIALTNDDEVNLAIVMTAALLRPDVRVFARAVAPRIAQRMQAFGNPTVVDPFDRFGDYLRVAIHSPSSFRLIEWLSGAPGSRLPRLREVPRGRWIVSGHGRFGGHVVADLRAEGMEVTVIEPGTPAADDPSMIVGYGTEPEVLARADPATAVGFIAATDNDTANLSMIASARAANPGLFLIARENAPSNHALFRAIGLDFALIASRVVAHEVLAHMTSPLLYRFLESLPRRDDAWASALVARLVRECGERLPDMWRVRLDDAGAPALVDWLADGRSVPLGLLLGKRARGRSHLRIVPLMRVRGDDALLTPDDDADVAAGDEFLFAGRGEARLVFNAVLASETARDRVLLGVDRPSGWVWRRLSRAGSAAGDRA
ncbi:MAG: NAD-binding protein [Burkholderiales bacterium]|nr:NAD-binding protein [Burkholderiales bacterium]